MGWMNLLQYIEGPGDTLGFYFQHWNSNYISIACIVVLVLMLSGYFYGCVFRRFIRPLQQIDCTLIGVLFIVALFQILIFILVNTKGSTDIAYYFLGGIIVFSPFLCLFTWSNILPTKKTAASLLLGILFSIILGYGSKNLNTNNIYFDSITYLSEVIESSQNKIFAHMIYPTGRTFHELDPLHDYTGYYYFWGMLLRWVRGIFSVKETLTPTYIWGATFLYAALLGNLVVNSACAIYKNQKWKGVLFTVAFMAPFYTNYFNTTLAFFGNTIRTVAVGGMVLIAYLILRYKSALLFIPLTACYYAAISFSSSSLFLMAFVMACLAVAMGFAKVKDYHLWIGFILSCYPLFHMVFVVKNSWEFSNLMAMLYALIIVAVLAVIAVLLRKKVNIINTVMMVALPVGFVGLAVVSFLLRNESYGYSYFFKTSSLDDMTVNMTSHVSTVELIRNILFYTLIALTLVNFKVERRFKFFLLAVLILFVNPLVQPAVSNFLTAGVYSRVFDLLNNPFTLCFLLYNLDRLIPLVPVNWAVLVIFGLFGLKTGYDTLTTPYSKSLTVGLDDWNWEAKVSNDSFDMYQYIKKTLSTNAFDQIDREYDERVFILSQDVGLKGYVDGIKISFSSENYRSALSGTLTGESAEFGNQMIALMYPDRKYTEDDMGESGDYSKLGALFQDSHADYVVINNTLAVWDERGWFAKPYQALIDNGMCQLIYENESWVLLKVDTDWEDPFKSTERYWVHKYE